MHTLERELIINAPAEEVWEFLATPVNLDRLTPPELHFRILSELPEQMYNGLTILYEVGIPLFGRWRWLTEIKHVVPGRSFVDEQRRGPYRFWYHHHEIAPLEDGRTRMLDKIHYRLPFGPLGEIVHRFRVRQMLERIFDYREEQLCKVFTTVRKGEGG